ncbi:uncharacterized protein LOC144355148 [Saccoglossus kowalevskii]
MEEDIRNQRGDLRDSTKRKKNFDVLDVLEPSKRKHGITKDTRVKENKKTEERQKMTPFHIIRAEKIIAKRDLDQPSGNPLDLDEIKLVRAHRIIRDDEQNDEDGEDEIPYIDENSDDENSDEVVYISSVFNTVGILCGCSRHYRRDGVIQARRLKHP